MAERIRLSIPAGQNFSHTLTWDENAGKMGSVEKLRWNIVVLEGLTVDLEISARLRDVANPVVVEREARGGTFVGDVRPSRNRRLAVAVAGVAGAASEGGGSSGSSTSRPKDAGESAYEYPGKQGLATTAPEVQEIVFSFRNGFSWFTAKEVELVTLREFSSTVPVLPVVSAALPLPERKGCGAAVGDTSIAPDLHKVTAVPIDGQLQCKVETLAARIEAALSLEINNECLEGKVSAKVDHWNSTIAAEAAALRDFCAAGPPRPNKCMQAQEADATAGQGEELYAHDQEADNVGYAHMEEQYDNEYEEQYDDHAAQDDVDGQQRCDAELDGDAEERARKARALEKARKFGMSV